MAQKRKILKEGDKFERYTIVSKLGEGGMGTVYQVYHAALDSTFALKILSPDVAEKDSEFVDRFVREARLSSHLRHPNLIAVHDAGRDIQNGMYYLVMDYVDGGSVREKLDKEGRLSPEQSIAVILQVLSALTEARKNKMVHRDIKPDNIMFTSAGVVKLADLGIAKATNDSEVTLTMEATIFGTPAYMSPQQAHNAKNVDCRADIYSLGIVFYEMLTGQCPYRGAPMEIIAQVVGKDEICDIRTVNPAIPDEIANIVMKMCAKNLEDRYQTPEEVLEDMEQLLDPDTPLESFFAGIEQKERTKTTVNDGSSIVTSRETWENEWRRRRKYKRILLAAGCLLAASGLIGGTVSFFSHLAEKRQQEEAERIALAQAEAVRKAEQIAEENEEAEQRIKELENQVTREAKDAALKINELRTQLTEQEQEKTEEAERSKQELLDKQKKLEQEKAIAEQRVKELEKKRAEERQKALLEAKKKAEELAAAKNAEAEAKAKAAKAEAEKAKEQEETAQKKEIVLEQDPWLIPLETTLKDGLLAYYNFDGKDELNHAVIEKSWIQNGAFHIWKSYQTKGKGHESNYFKLKKFNFKNFSLAIKFRLVSKSPATGHIIFGKQYPNTFIIGYKNDILYLDFNQHPVSTNMKLTRNDWNTLFISCNGSVTMVILNNEKQTVSIRRDTDTGLPERFWEFSFDGGNPSTALKGSVDYFRVYAGNTIPVSKKFSKRDSSDGVTFSEDKKQLIRYFSQNAVYKIPMGVETICENAFQDSKIGMVYIPASVKEIKGNPFGPRRVGITLDPANKHFVMKSGMLFSKDMTRLIYAIGAGRHANRRQQEDVKSLSKKIFSLAGIGVQPKSKTAENNLAKNREQAVILMESSKSPSFLVIPDGVNIIEEYALMNNMFEMIAIPESVKTIHAGAFANSRNLKYVLFAEGVTSLGPRVFLGCKQLIAADLPKTLSTLGEDTFIGCERLTSIILSPNITHIPDRCFYGCRSLEDYIIPDHIESIGAFAFGNCSSLKRIRIPRSVKDMKNPVGAFEKPKVLIDKSNSTFSVKDDVIYNKEKGSLVLYPPQKNEMTYFLPAGIKEIESGAFANPKKLREIRYRGSLKINNEPFPGISKNIKVTEL